MTKYKDQILDPRWQRNRLEIMQRDGFRCVYCSSDKKTLNVHHLYYDAGKKIYEYDSETLVTLCSDCHKFVHAELSKATALIAFFAIRKRIDLVEMFNRLAQ